MKIAQLGPTRSLLFLAAAFLAFTSTLFGAAPIITNIAIVGAQPRLGIQADVGTINEIQFSTNLNQTNWTALTSLVVTQSPYSLVDAAPSPTGRRFYRVLAFPTPPANTAFIPSGSFQMGDTFSEGDTDERPLHAVYVSAFYLEKYLVTKTLWDEVYQWAITNGYSFDNEGLGKAPNHPVQSISWYDTVKWCNARSEKEGRVPAYYLSPAQTTVYRSGQTNVQNDWVKWTAGYRLPTEAEWEKAARGGANGHRFAWSDADTISHSRANYIADPGYTYDVSPTTGYNALFDDGVFPYTNPVGYFAANDYGLYDMAGNVWEWCWDYFDSSWYSNSAAKQDNCRGPFLGNSSKDRVLRGGCWRFETYYLRCAYRNAYFPASNAPFCEFGFRCGRGI